MIVALLGRTLDLDAIVEKTKNNDEPPSSSMGQSTNDCLFWYALLSMKKQSKEPILLDQVDTECIGVMNPNKIGFEDASFGQWGKVNYRYIPSKLYYCFLERDYPKDSRPISESVPLRVNSTAPTTFSIPILDYLECNYEFAQLSGKPRFE